MDSLLASYASSDEEDQVEPQQQKTTSSYLSNLPQPKSSSSISSSLLQPKQQHSLNDDTIEIPKSTSSAPPKPSFSSLPLPKPKSQTKKIVQFKPPRFSSSSSNPLDDDDDDDDDDEKEKRRRKAAAAQTSLQTSSVTSFLSTIPAPRNSSSLGSGSSFGSGRTAIVINNGSDNSAAVETDNRVDADHNVANYDYNTADGTSSYDGNSANAYGVDPNTGSGSGGYVGYEAYGNYQAGVDQSGEGYGYDSYGGYEGYGGSGSYAAGAEYGNYQGYTDNWGDASGNVSAVSEMSGGGDSALRVLGKRGRNGVPAEIVEVKQDELMKNRPREDQVKLTGIAFGPSYKPVPTGAKPSKQHKRKHQIGSLYYDMKQKEMELAERRAKGFLTKAETHAKYGW